MAKRDSCVFYASWFDAIEVLPEAVQSEAYRAILSFALRGVETEKQGAMTKLIMAMVRPQIEANNKRYENGCKGGRPKAENNQTITKPKPNQNQTKTKPKPNDNVNDNVNDNGVCENTTHTHEEIFQKFKIQCEKVAPLALAFKEPLTVEQFATLYDTYGWQKIAQCATELHNKEACYHNRRAYTAWRAFMAKIK